MDGSLNPNRLDYAARPSLKHRVWRRVEWGIIALLIGIVFVWIGPIAWRNARLVYWQGQCLSHSDQPDNIVHSPSSGISNSTAARTRFYEVLGIAVPPGFSTLYMHERVSPGGNRRLIILDVATVPVQNYHLPLTFGLARVFKLGTATTAPQELYNKGQSVLERFFDPSLAIYAGQNDPADASHFTIRVIDSRGTTIIDGWLRDDDIVVFEPRPTQPLPSTAPGPH